jgi:DNA mismatch repair protein MSH4
VARETFKENVTDIYDLGRELSEMHGLPLALVYQDSGFIFQLKKSESEGQLPAEFINITEKKGRIVFSTLDLVRPSSGIGTFHMRVLISVPRPQRKSEMRG